MKELSDFVVAVTDTIHTAMEKITRNKRRAVVVVDGAKVVGTVSDGDLRRAFLDEVLPIAPVEKIMNLNCRMTTDTDPQRLAQIVRQEKVTVLPIVNAQNELMDVYVAEEPFL